MSKDLPDHKDLCDMSGITEELKKEFGRKDAHRKEVNGKPEVNGQT